MCSFDYLCFVNNPLERVGAIEGRMCPISKCKSGLKSVLQTGRRIKKENVSTVIFGLSES